MCRSRIGPPSVGGPSRRGITRERANKMSVITNNRKAIPTIGIRWRQQWMRAATISISRLGCAMVVRCKAEQRNRHFPLPRSPHPGRSVEGRWSSRSSRGGRSAPHLTTHRVVPLRNAFAWRRPPKRCRSVDYKMALARGSGRPNAKRLALDPRPTSFRRVGQRRRGGPALRGLVPTYLMDTGTVSAQQ